MDIRHRKSNSIKKILSNCIDKYELALYMVLGLRAKWRPPGILKFARKTGSRQKPKKKSSYKSHHKINNKTRGKNLFLP